MFKVVLLNPPHAVPVQRRYMCSYNAQNMLLPPQELIALGGILRHLQGVETFLIDAIAEKINTNQLRGRLQKIQPSLVISIQGFECFEEDMNELNAVKQHFPATTVAVFGHYSTVFPSEILEKTKVDVVIRGEPDLIFKELIEAFLLQKPLRQVAGIAFREKNVIVINEGDTRIKQPDKLPMPAYELLQADKYFEPFLKAPFGLIQSARGCPYSCNYCVRSFGRKLTYRTPEQIIDEILYLKKQFGIRSLRFIDDTFTVQPARVIEICKMMIEQNIELEWTCLSRLDSLKEEMLPWMKKSGCKRIYFGVESGSKKVLQFLNKEMDLDKAAATIHSCKRHGIETFGWFIVGAPNEDEEAFEESIRFAIRADFDYIAVSELTVYPGTELYDKLRHSVQFSLLPYANNWNDPERVERNKKREREFYQRFYFRRRYAVSKVKHALNYPVEYFRNIIKLANYLAAPHQTKRADYF